MGLMGPDAVFAYAAFAQEPELIAQVAVRTLVEIEAGAPGIASGDWAIIPRAVPEPSTAALIMLCLVILVGLRRRTTAGQWPGAWLSALSRAI